MLQVPGKRFLLPSGFSKQRASWRSRVLGHAEMMCSTETQAQESEGRPALLESQDPHLKVDGVIARAQVMGLVSEWHTFMQ